MQALVNSTKSFIAKAYHEFMQSRLVAEMPNVPDAFMERFVISGSGDAQDGTAATQSPKAMSRKSTKHGRQEAPVTLALLGSLSA